MPVKPHPFYNAGVGAVIAVGIAPSSWCFVRFYRDTTVKVLPIVSSNPTMPRFDWDDPEAGWVMMLVAMKADPTEATHLGVLPFPDEDSEWPPPCYYPPDLMQNCYRAIHRGRLIKPLTIEDVKGMKLCSRATTPQLIEFMREKLAAGELTRV
jgi:hypothetical protein